MPTPRTLLALPVSLAFLCLSTATSQGKPGTGHKRPGQPAGHPGRSPAAALLAHDGTGLGTTPAGADHERAATDYALGTTAYAHSGIGISRADHFRAGSITKTFIATVVLQLAAEHRLSLSDTVEQHLRVWYTGRATTGAR